METINDKVLKIKNLYEIIKASDCTIHNNKKTKSQIHNMFLIAS